MFRKALIASTLLLAPFAVAQDQSAMDEQMAEFFKMMEPGEMHEYLDHFVGEWDVTSKAWWGGPGSEPVVSQGTSKAKWVLNGRFVQEEFQGEMMGMPFSGLGYTGFDTFKEVYVTSWMDSMGTAIFTTEGRVSSDGKTFIFYGTMDEAMTGEHDKPVKFVLKVVSDDIHRFEMHDLALESLGMGTKVMEMTYTRSKK